MVLEKNKIRIYKGSEARREGKQWKMQKGKSSLLAKNYTVGGFEKY